ncbi:MAG: beta-lactamase family protein [Cytophagales bacterium]|nr:beta-lactamase family protein [Cytophagales bacterium]
MKNKFLRGCLFLALPALLAACTGPVIPTSAPCRASYPDVNASHPRAAQYQEALEVFRRKNKIPGAVLLVASPNAGLWIGSSGYADLEHRVPVQACDRFRVASTTKALIGTVVMQLCDEGKMSLDDRLADLLPAVNGNIPHAARITVRQLLGHTSGIHDYQEDLNYRLDMFNSPRVATAKTSADLLRDYVYGKPADFQPGQRWGYSNSNFNLLELIIEKTEGKTAQQVLAERLFTPLGMEGYFEARDDAGLVRGYRDLYDNGTLVSTAAWDPTDDGQGDGGFVGTAYDLYRFSRALFGGKLVTPASLAGMTTPVVPGSDYGLALQYWSVGNRAGWGHAGQAYGFQSWMIYFPEEGVHLVLLVNLSNRPSRESFRELVESVVP